MVVRVGCEHCKGRFKADDKFRGKRAKCPKCGEDITIVESPSQHSAQSKVTPPRIPKLSSNPQNNMPVSVGITRRDVYVFSALTIVGIIFSSGVYYLNYERSITSEQWSQAKFVSKTEVIRILGRGNEAKNPYWSSDSPTFGELYGQRRFPSDTVWMKWRFPEADDDFDTTEPIPAYAYVGFSGDEVVLAVVSGTSWPDR